MSIRVVYVIPASTFGGAHNQVVQFAPSLRAHGYEPVVVLPRDAGNASERFAQAGIETHRRNLVRIRATSDWRVQARFARAFPRQARTLAGLFRELGADVVQAHGITQVDVALAASRIDVPLVWQLLDTRSPAALNRMMAPFLRRLPTS